MDKHLFLSLAIPAVFLAMTGGIKTLVKHHFLWSNFYLGIDVALTAFANGIINIVDLGRGLAHPGATVTPGLEEKLYYNAIILVLSFGCLLAVMMIHQRMDGPPPTDIDKYRKLKRGIWMGVVANVIGVGSLTVFIVARLRGQL